MSSQSSAGAGQNAPMDAQQAAWYAYYQQHPEMMAQWQQYQAAAAAYYYSGQGGSSGSASWQGYAGGGHQGRSPNYGGGGGYGGYGGEGGGRTSSRQNPPSNTLWVGSIPSGTTHDEVRAEFERFGRVELVRILDAKNCAFVTFGDMDSANAAYSGSIGIRIRGSEIKVNWGKETNLAAIHGGGGGGGSSYGGSESMHHGRPSRYQGGHDGPGGGQREDFNTPSANIYVGNVDPNTQEHDIRAIFERFGQIEKVKIFSQKACAFVYFNDISSAVTAKNEMNGYMLYGQAIRVNFGKTNPRQDRGGYPGGYDPSRPNPYGNDQYGHGNNNYPPRSNHGPSSSHYVDQGRTAPSSSSQGTSASPSGSQQPPPSQPIPMHEPQNVSTEMKELVDKLVDAFGKKPELENQMKSHQADNPKYSFLFPGKEGHDYFLWKKYGQSMAAEQQASPTSLPSFQPPAIPESSPPFSVDENEELEGLLRNTDPTSDRIKNAAGWILARPTKAASSAHHFYAYVFGKLLSNQTPLFFLYLLHEIFNMCKSEDPSFSSDSNATSIRSAFVPTVPKLLQLVRQSGEAATATVKALLDKWQTEHFLSPDDLEIVSDSDYSTSDSKKRKRDDISTSKESILEGEEEPASKRRDLGDA